MRTIWRHYQPWAWLALGISLVTIGFLTFVYAVAPAPWLQLAFSYLGVLYIGVALRGIFLTHRRGADHALGQVILINRLNARHDRGELGHDEWAQCVALVLGLGGLDADTLHRKFR